MKKLTENHAKNGVLIFKYNDISESDKLISDDKADKKLLKKVAKDEKKVAKADAKLQKAEGKLPI